MQEHALSSFALLHANLDYRRWTSCLSSPPPHNHGRTLGSNGKSGASLTPPMNPSSDCLF